MSCFIAHWCCCCVLFPPSCSPWFWHSADERGSQQHSLRYQCAECWQSPPQHQHCLGEVIPTGDTAGGVPYFWAGDLLGVRTIVGLWVFVGGKKEEEEVDRLIVVFLWLEMEGGLFVCFSNDGGGNVFFPTQNQSHQECVWAMSHAKTAHFLSLLI